MLLSALKYLLGLVIGGGLLAPFIGAWLRRRDARLKHIPLIERVNRLVDPRLEGFTLARVLTSGSDRRLEEVQGVREFQLTLRNTSVVHLHNSEIQFEFPTAEVEGWAERPARSKTPPILLDAKAAKPWERAFRWRIPEFPPTDQIEFTFRAIDPPSDDYEVALYNAGQVVVEKSKGEPPSSKSTPGEVISRLTSLMGVVVLVLIVAEIAFFIWRWRNPTIGDHSTVVAWAGCSLDFESHFDQEDSGLFSSKGPWTLTADILNTGPQKCFVQFGASGGKPFAVAAGDSDELFDAYVSKRPRLVPVEVTFGPDDPVNKATVMLYKEPR